jgi:hypothetical protein
MSVPIICTRLTRRNVQNDHILISTTDRTSNMDCEFHDLPN